MADSMIAFAKGSKLPTVEEFITQMKIMGVELEEWEENYNLKDMGIAGVWPGKYKGVEIGFEFDAVLLEEEEYDDFDWIDDFKDILDGRDYRIDFTFRSEDEVYASAIGLAVLCKMSDALALDDDEELTVNASNADEWVEEFISSM